MSELDIIILSKREEITEESASMSSRFPWEQVSDGGVSNDLTEPILQLKEYMGSNFCVKVDLMDKMVEVCFESKYDWNMSYVVPEDVDEDDCVVHNHPTFTLHGNMSVDDLDEVVSHWESFGVSVKVGNFTSQ